MAGVELWLVRHGETEHSRDGRMAGWVDVPLTGGGEEHARALRKLLDNERFDSVWSSDLNRALATARLAWGEPRPDPRPREISFGVLESQPWDSLEECHRQGLIDYAGFDPPGGETIERLRERVAAFLAELSPGCHLLFTHGGVIRLLTREAGEDGFPPNGTVIALDWTGRRVLFRRERPGVTLPPFSQ